MALLILNEAVFFAYLLFSYFYLASSATGAWPPSGRPDLSLALPNTAVLLLSSATMWWAERGITQGKPGRLRLGLLITFLLGAAFLTVQGIEYTRLPFAPADSSHASLFYTITGFHGAHVLAGLVMNLVVQIWARMGVFTRERHQAVTNIGWYWHFVDAVWLAVLATLYLSPYLR
jgi:heme/copper-type cytochrome/quinol oxidase subunit 3